MSEHKFTPGPWKVIPPMHGHPTDYQCVQIGADETYTTLEMLPADARLVAAAPDLLVACKKAKAALDKFGLDWLGKDEDPLEAAIRKAEGGDAA